MKTSLNARGTLVDIANILGVSAATVSNAFNRPDQLSAQLREKILATARSLKYGGPNPAARMLRTGFSNTIAVVYSEPLHHAFEDTTASIFLGGVAEACAAQRLALLILQGGESNVQTAAVDGLIIYSMPKDDALVCTVADRVLPMVVVDQPMLPKVPFIGIDERAAARACAQHLLDLGHQSFAIVTFRLGFDGHCGLIDRKRLKRSSFELTRRRIEGYLEVLNGSRPGVSIKIWECPRSNEEGGRTAAENLFKNKPRPTAILATSDRLAMGVMEVARKQQLRIPDDLAVVGFDDIPAAKWIAPQLTTVRQPVAEKGRLAVASLLKEKGPLRTMVPTELIIRQSSDPSILRTFRTD